MVGYNDLGENIHSFLHSVSLPDIMIELSCLYHAMMLEEK